MVYFPVTLFYIGINIFIFIYMYILCIYSFPANENVSIIEIIWHSKKMKL